MALVDFSGVSLDVGDLFGFVLIQWQQGNGRYRCQRRQATRVEGPASGSQEATAGERIAQPSAASSATATAATATRQ